MTWSQVYDPLGHPLLSTILAAVPVIVLLGALGVLKMRAHRAALLALATSLLIATFIFHMPASMAFSSLSYGAAYGLFPIGWIILNVIFLYQLTQERGLFDILRESITGLTQDARLQLLLIAFSFGAFFEGASGFGTPLAVTGALLIGLGFTPLAASGLSLIASTAPVAFGALGRPIIGVQSVTGLDLQELSAMVGRQLPFFSIIVPFWLIWAFAGFRGMIEIWPAILVAGVCFAVPQFLVSNFHGPWLVDVVAAIASIASLSLFLKFWQPKNIWRGSEARPLGRASSTDALADARALARLLENSQAGQHITFDHRRDDGDWIHDSLFRHGRDARPGFCKDRLLVPLLRDDAGLARRCPDRLRHFFQRLVWKSAKDH